MDKSLEDQIDEFVGKIKPVTPDMMAISEGKILKKEKTEEEIVVQAAVAEEGEACFTKGFKDLVGALPQRYIGVNIKDLLVEFTNSIPQCEVVSA